MQGDGHALRDHRRGAPAAGAGEPAVALAAFAGTGKSITACGSRLARSRSPTVSEKLRPLLKAYGELQVIRYAGLAGVLAGDAAADRDARQHQPAVAHLDRTQDAARRSSPRSARYMPVEAVYDWSGGLVWLEVPQSADAGATDIRRVIALHGGHATLIRAEAAVRAAIEVFQPLDPGVERLIAPPQGDVRSCRRAQSRPHVRRCEGVDERIDHHPSMPTNTMQTNFTPEQLADPRIAEVDASCAAACTAACAPRPARPTSCSATSATARAAAST